MFLKCDLKRLWSQFPLILIAWENADVVKITVLITIVLTSRVSDFVINSGFL